MIKQHPTPTLTHQENDPIRQWVPKSCKNQFNECKENTENIMNVTGDKENTEIVELIRTEKSHINGDETATLDEVKKLTPKQLRSYANILKNILKKCIYIKNVSLINSNLFIREFFGSPE